MITPVFEVDQNEDFVIVKMRAPHIKVNTFDFYIQERTFKFYGKPYFLRLVFSSPLVEDGREKASFDVDTGLLTVLLPKQVGNSCRSLMKERHAHVVIRTKERSSVISIC